MADLVKTVWVRRKLYGPGNPPPPELWDELPADVWDEPPSVDNVAVLESGDEPGDLADLLGASLQPSTPTPLESLALLPDDKDTLLAFADAHGLDVDRRKGPAKIRAELQAALA